MKILKKLRIFKRIKKLEKRAEEPKQMLKRPEKSILIDGDTITLYGCNDKEEGFIPCVLCDFEDDPIGCAGVRIEDSIEITEVKLSKKQIEETIENMEGPWWDYKGTPKELEMFSYHDLKDIIKRIEEEQYEQNL